MIMGRIGGPLCLELIMFDLCMALAGAIAIILGVDALFGYALDKDDTDMF